LYLKKHKDANDYNNFWLCEEIVPEFQLDKSEHDCEFEINSTVKSTHYPASRKFRCAHTKLIYFATKTSAAGVKHKGVSRVRRAD
jgi:hypothetical protein